MRYAPSTVSAAVAAAATPGPPSGGGAEVQVSKTDGSTGLTLPDRTIEDGSTAAYRFAEHTTHAAGTAA